MRISNKNRMALLFISSESPFFKQIIDFEGGSNRTLRVSTVERLLGVPAQTRYNWMVGRFNAKTFSDALHRVTAKIDAMMKDGSDAAEGARLKSVVNTYQSLYDQGTDTSSQVGKVIGLTPKQVKRIIDEAINANRPLLRGAYYDKKADGESHLESFGGIYLVYAQRGEHWLRCTLDVRYLIEVGTGHFLRCKLNVPVVAGELIENRSHIELDGPLSVRNRRLFFHLERRAHAANDYFNFITCTGKIMCGSLLLKGNYLTTDQTSSQNIVAGSLLLKRVCAVADDDDDDCARQVILRSSKQLDSTDDATELKEVATLLSGYEAAA